MSLEFSFSPLLDANEMFWTDFWNDHSTLVINRCILLCKYVILFPNNYAIINCI